MEQKAGRKSGQRNKNGAVGKRALQGDVRDSQVAVHEGLLLLDAVALFRDGNAESGLRCIKKLQKSRNLHELVDLLCPGLALQHDRRAQRIRRVFLNPGNEGDAFSSMIKLAGRVPEMAGSSALTPRQKLVLGMVRDGLSNRQIAARLLVSENTVKWHLKGLSRKLGANNRLAMIRIAEHERLVSARDTVYLRSASR
jgi:DNA-binding CsgD family transcriptional regulator